MIIRAFPAITPAWPPSPRRNRALLADERRFLHWARTLRSPGLTGRPGQTMTTPAAPAPAAGPDSLRRRVLTAAALALVAAGLFLCYVTVSGKVPVTSDGAGNALQAWSMLHGNWLLRGWWLSDVSFYTTELPQYMLVE